MAATVSPWAKPGAWALAAEEQEAELEEQQEAKAEQQQRAVSPPAADFPSLSAAAAVKPKKKKKAQPISLSEFTTFGGPKPEAQPAGLTIQDRMSLPTGPRERTAEELDRSRLGGGFRSYGSDRGNSRYSNGGDESSESKWGSGQRKEPTRDGPSKADEVDDWGAAKKSAASNGFDRRERGPGGGFFGGSQSKADESDNWGSNKSSVSSRFGDRERKVGFPSSGGADSDSWGRRKEESNGGSGFDRERRVGFGSNGGGADSEIWGKKREDRNSGTSEVSSRPRLNLQPRTLPVTVETVQPVALPVSEEAPPVFVPAPKVKAANPFGEARPREQVLAEKGKDWKKIDEELESVKIKEAAERAESPSFGKRGFGNGNGRIGDRTEGAWRRAGVADARPQSGEGCESNENSEEPPENGQVDDEHADDES